MRKAILLVLLVLSAATLFADSEDGSKNVGIYCYPDKTMMRTAEHYAHAETVLGNSVYWLSRADSLPWGLDRVYIVSHGWANSGNNGGFYCNDIGTGNADVHMPYRIFINVMKYRGVTDFFIDAGFSGQAIGIAVELDAGMRIISSSTAFEPVCLGEDGVSALASSWTPGEKLPASAGRDDDIHPQILTPEHPSQPRTAFHDIEPGDDPAKFIEDIENDGAMAVASMSFHLRVCQ